MKIEPIKNVQKTNRTTIRAAETIEQPRTNNSHQSSTAYNQSAQLQLCSLAKLFNIDAQLNEQPESDSIEERSRKRIRIEQVRKQQNLEKITFKAAQLCSDSEVSDRADPDWFYTFLQFSENISNNTMQELWAKILAKEVSSPGSFSLKTLEIFRSLSLFDAKLIAKVASFAASDHNKNNKRILSGCYQLPGILNFLRKNRVNKIDLNKCGLSYSDILHLGDKKLLFTQEAESNALQKGESLNFLFHGQQLSFTPLKNDSILTFYKFTPAGGELLSLIADKADSDYLNELTHNFSQLFHIK